MIKLIQKPKSEKFIIETLIDRVLENCEIELSEKINHTSKIGGNKS